MTTDNCEKSDQDTPDTIQDREPQCSTKNINVALYWAKQLKLFFFLVNGSLTAVVKIESDLEHITQALYCSCNLLTA